MKDLLRAKAKVIIYPKKKKGQKLLAILVVFLVGNIGGKVVIEKPINKRYLKKNYSIRINVLY